MGSSAQNQKSTTTSTITTTNNTNIVQSRGADATSIANALGGSHSPASVASGGIPGNPASDGGAGGDGGGGGAAAGAGGLSSALVQQILIGVVVTVAVGWLMHKGK